MKGARSNRDWNKYQSKTVRSWVINLAYQAYHSSLTVFQLYSTSWTCIWKHWNNTKYIENQEKLAKECNKATTFQQTSEMCTVLSCQLEKIGVVYPVLHKAKGYKQDGCMLNMCLVAQDTTTCTTGHICMLMFPLFLQSYGQQFGSSMSAIPMQSPGSQQSQAFHSMSATQMIPQDMNTGLMPSDVMMQSPPPQQQQRQRQYPQQHMGYGNGSYSGYGAGYTSQRPMAQTQLSPAATYGSFQQDGGFIGNRGEFSPTSPTNQAMPPLRSPGVPGVMSSSQSMYYANNGPYCTSPSVSPMAAQAGYTGGVGLTQSVQNPGLPLMSPEQPYISSGFPPPSATQKQMQGNVMANFFQSPHQQLMSGPVRSHQAQSGNIPQQKAMPSSPRLFPPDMKMYNMPQEGFQQMPRPTSAGYAAQFHQQRSCMFDRSASSALQQLHQAQQLKAQAGSRSTRRASNPSLGNHNLPKSPNQKSSPRSTPSPKVHSPLPGMVTSPPPTRHKAPGKEQGGKQNAGPVPSSIPPPSPKNKQSRPASKKRRVVSPPANERKAEPDVSPERVQVRRPITIISHLLLCWYLTHVAQSYYSINHIHSQEFLDIFILRAQLFVAWPS